MRILSQDEIRSLRGREGKGCLSICEDEILEFVESGAAVCEADGYIGKYTPEYAYDRFKAASRSLYSKGKIGFNQIEVSRKRGKLYLVNRHIDNTIKIR